MIFFFLFCAGAFISFYIKQFSSRGDIAKIYIYLYTPLVFFFVKKKRTEFEISWEEARIQWRDVMTREEKKKQIFIFIAWRRPSISYFSLFTVNCSSVCLLGRSRGAITASLLAREWSAFLVSSPAVSCVCVCERKTATQPRHAHTESQRRLRDRPVRIYGVQVFGQSINPPVSFLPASEFLSSSLFDEHEPSR